MIAEGVHSLYIKAGDGSTPDPQFTPAVVTALKAAGVSVCAWTFVYGVHPAGEAAVALAAVHDGAQCLVVDAEGQYDGRYGAAQRFVHAVRAGVGAGFPLGLAGQAEVGQHPTFPYSVFLGPGGFGFDLPQMYWRDLGVSVDAAYRATVAANRDLRPPDPAGRTAVRIPEPGRDRALPLARRGIREHRPQLLQPGRRRTWRPGRPARSVATDRRAQARPGPTLRPGADGDQVVWAQELLNAGGARLPVGGFFGAQTTRALVSFQARSGLRPDGVLDPATWRRLMRLRAREPSWANAPPQSAQG